MSEDLPAAYQTYYTHNSSGGAIARDFLYRVYRLAVALPGMLVGIQRARMSLESMFLADCEPGGLLDVGCGDGTFLARMRRRGWHVAGVDFDAKAIASAKRKYGLNLRQGELRDAAFPPDSFDAITLNHVIEHVPQPLDVLVECRRLLKPQGRLIVMTPNAAGLGHERFGSYWDGLDPPRHLHIFSSANLAKCARRAGLEVLVAESTAGRADTIIGASYSIRDNPSHRRAVRPPPNLARTLKAVLFQFREHDQVRSGADVGEEVVLICAKASA